MNPGDRVAELEALVKFGIEIIEEERRITHSSFRESDGIVRDYYGRRELAKYTRWLKRARKVLR